MKWDLQTLAVQVILVMLCSNRWRIQPGKEHDLGLTNSGHNFLPRGIIPHPGQGIPHVHIIPGIADAVLSIQEVTPEIQEFKDQSLSLACLLIASISFHQYTLAMGSP